MAEELDFDEILRRATRAETRGAGKGNINREDRLLEEEVATLIKSQNEINDAIIKRRQKRVKIEQMRINVRMRINFSKSVFRYLCYFSLFCGSVIMLQGFNPKFDVHYKWLLNFRLRLGGFHLSKTPLVTLIGSTAVSVLGLVAIVLRGLFRGGAKDEKSPAEKKQ